MSGEYTKAVPGHRVAIECLEAKSLLGNDNLTSGYVWYQGSARVDDNKVEINAMVRGCRYDNHRKAFVPGKEAGKPEVTIAVRQFAPLPLPAQEVEQVLQAYVDASLHPKPAPAKTSTARGS